MFKLVCTFFLIIAGVLASSIAIAGNNQYSRAYQLCVKAAHNSLTVRCATNELQRQQDKLDREVETLMEILPPSRKARLTRIQYLFEKYRDENCKFYDTSLRGSALIMHDVNSAQCRLYMTAHRADELRYFVQVNGG